MSRFLDENRIYYVRSHVQYEMSRRLPWAYIVNDFGQNPWAEEMPPGYYEVIGWGAEKADAKLKIPPARYNIPSWDRLPEGQEYYILASHAGKYAILAEVARENFIPHWRSHDIENIVENIIRRIHSLSREGLIDNFEYSTLIKDSQDNK